MHVIFMRAKLNADVKDRLHGLGTTMPACTQFAVSVCVATVLGD